MKKNKVELLAPAGNLLKLKTAFAFGADAVYFGLPDFSLRVRINDFSLKDMKAGIDYAHSINKKAYVTVNIFAHNTHLSKVKRHIEQLKSLGPDALFVADPGLIYLIKEVWPEVKISLSTQANCTNWMSAQMYKDMGVKRVILGRELALKEVKEVITKVPGLEIETFVHGALCMAYSGRCFLSKYLIDRDANLGDCAQPCRWQYEVKPLGHEAKFVLGEDKNGSYIFNSLDLCLIKRIPEMISAKIKAFKIEGRAKSVYYLANVVGAYRRAIDISNDKSFRAEDRKKELSYLYKELESKLYHRGFTEGFMFNSGREAQNLKNENNLPNWEFCGQTISSENDSKVKGDYKYKTEIKVHNTLKKGDTLELVMPGYEVIKFKLKKMLDKESQEEIVEAHGGGGGQTVYMYFEKKIPQLSVLRRKIN
ncbi:MAG TPA: U32 family peptidase C-terminal domain-containing protein [Patescibacteria group bacterium]|nr:U32 family peptidase C-terminal domain-containing protein [Patescibacteria group bacterium]